MNKNQRGFTAVEGLIIFVIAGLIGGVGWYVYHLKQHKDTTYYNPPSQSQSTADKQSTNSSSSTIASDASKSGDPDKLTTKDTLVISAWKVKLKLSKPINLQVGQISDSSYGDNDRSVDLIAPDLSATWKCSDSPTIASISRTTQAKRAGPYEPVATKKIGDYTYGLEAVGFTQCTDDSRAQQWADQLKTDFNKLISY